MKWYRGYSTDDGKTIHILDTEAGDEQEAEANLDSAIQYIENAEWTGSIMTQKDYYETESWVNTQ